MSSIRYDEITDPYARHRDVHPQVFRALVETISPVANVLEVGCGTGNYIAAIRAATGCPCWGIDPSAEMLARARTQAPEVRFAFGRGEQIDLPGGQFDLVYSVDVIHHVEDRRAYLAEAYRVLVDGGRLCTATDSEWIICHRQPLATYFPETVEVELARYPSIETLREAMAEVGFVGTVEETVEHEDALTDIQAYREKAYSILHLIPEAAFRRGIARMERDLGRGPIARVSRYTLLWGTRGGKKGG
jgi:ubiquinone/menaquinone biosynthesis C-methylase UbiE